MASDTSAARLDVRKAFARCRAVMSALSPAMMELNAAGDPGCCGTGHVDRAYEALSAARELCDGLQAVIGEAMDEVAGNWPRTRRAVTCCCRTGRPSRRKGMADGLEQVAADALRGIPGLPRPGPHAEGRAVIAALAEAGYSIVRTEDFAAEQLPGQDKEDDDHAGGLG